MICTFFGERKLNEDKDLIKSKVLEEVERLLMEGYDTFYFDGYGEFDALCYEVVSNLKEVFSDIKRILVRTNFENLEQDIINIYFQKYEDCKYLKRQNRFGKLRIICKSYAMIDSGDFVVFYINKDGKTHYELDYAELKKKKFVNLSD